jgi:hypothetical protein
LDAPDSYILDQTIRWVPANQLKPASDNPRVSLRLSNPAAFEGLKRSIQRGFFAPLLVEGSSQEIIGGHQRWDAARDAGLETVPVLFLKDLTPEERTRIRIADNGSFGSWNIHELTIQIESLPADELPMLGLDAPTLDLVQPLEEGQGSPADDTPAFETLTFKLPRDAAEIVQGIIKEFCTVQKCKPGSALERIVVEWSQSPDNSLAA